MKSKQAAPKTQHQLLKTKARKAAMLKPKQELLKTTWEDWDAASDDECVDATAPGEAWDGATDTGGDGCDWYWDNDEKCGEFDDEDFIADWDCCACGGGAFMYEWDDDWDYDYDDDYDWDWDYDYYDYDWDDGSYSYSDYDWDYFDDYSTSYDWTDDGWYPDYNTTDYSDSYGYY